MTARERQDAGRLIAWWRSCERYGWIRSVLAIGYLMRKLEGVPTSPKLAVECERTLAGLRQQMQQEGAIA